MIDVRQRIKEDWGFFVLGFLVIFGMFAIFGAAMLDAQGHHSQATLCDKAGGVLLKTDHPDGIGNWVCIDRKAVIILGQ